MRLTNRGKAVCGLLVLGWFGFLFLFYLFMPLLPPWVE